MVGYILIDPNQVHSYREFGEDHELTEALDNYYSMQCFAAENRFINISTNENVKNEEIFANASSWFRTYMLTDETQNGKWIGFIQFYNPNLRVLANHANDLAAFKTLMHFFEDPSVKQELQYDVLIHAVYIAMNMVIEKYQCMPYDMDAASLKSLKDDFSNYTNFFGRTIFNTESRRSFWFQMEAILESSKVLHDYYLKTLETLERETTYDKEMYMQVYVDDKYYNQDNLKGEIISRVKACEESFLNELGNDWVIIDENNISKTNLHTTAILKKVS